MGLPQPAHKKGSGDIVRQVRNDLSGSRRKACGIQFQGILPDNMQTIRIVPGQLFEQRPSAFINFHSIDAACRTIEQSACQATRAGSDFNNASPCQIAAQGDDPSTNSGIQKKVLTKGFLCIQAISLNGLFQRRKAHVS